MTDTPTPTAPGSTAGQAHAAPKGMWPKLRMHILHPELTSEQVAWSFALGLTIAFNPLLGLHTALIITFCLLFKRLHRPLIVAGGLVNNPWTTVPIASLEAYVGNILRGRGLDLDLSVVRWHEIGWRSFLTWDGFQSMVLMVRPILHSYLLGGTVLCLASLPAGYYLMLWLTRHLRNRHGHPMNPA
ncbi:MAG TPA: DUF2062 domain-containing protein [Holophagaceae bacterium]|nr:DUF2062 domain-containing protein [Holophagaceae bacterium]